MYSIDAIDNEAGIWWHHSIPPSPFFKSWLKKQSWEPEVSTQIVGGCSTCWDDRINLKGCGLLRCEFNSPSQAWVFELRGAWQNWPSIDHSWAWLLSDAHGSPYPILFDIAFCSLCHISLLFLSLKLHSVYVYTKVVCCYLISSTVWVR